MRGSERRHRVIDVPAARAWEAISRAELLHLWFPGLVDCQLDGSTRTITTGAGLKLDEAIITTDALQRRFQYRITGGLFREHLASLDVLTLDALGPDTCLVTYASDAEPSTMALILGGAMEQALDSLAEQLETGTGPLVTALAEPTTDAATDTAATDTVEAPR